MKLNLGSGQFKKKGYVNLDYDKKAKPDVLHNLNKFPYPFKDNSFELIEADHVLEHLESPFEVMKELQRILKVGGVMNIKVPHFSRGFMHPGHMRGFDVSFPLYFNSNFKGGYVGVELYLKKLKMNWFAQPYLKKQNLSKAQYLIGYSLGGVLSRLANASPYMCSRMWCFLVGGFEEIEFEFIKRTGKKNV